MSEVKETICSNCEHLWVCKYKDELLLKIKSVDEIMNGSRFSYNFFCSDYIEKRKLFMK